MEPSAGGEAVAGTNSGKSVGQATSVAPATPPRSTAEEEVRHPPFKFPQLTSPIIQPLFNI